MKPTSRVLALVLVSLTAIAAGALAAQPGKNAPAGSSARNRIVASWLRSLRLQDRVAQMVIVPYYGDAPHPRSEAYRKYLQSVRTLHVGGLVLINRVEAGRLRYSEPYEMAAFLNRMQKASRLPLLVAGDFERGDSMRIETETLFPHAMAFAATRDPELSRWEGAVTARQGLALGVPWILAPVADVNNNPDNPIINIRSYGENPDEVAAHVRAFIEGAHSAGPVLVTVKHFPGHGDVVTDTHMALAVNSAGRDRLEKIELPPFRAAIAARVDSVMSAHIAVPALDAPDIPATLSQPILNGLLRKELGFHGLISTDALDMQGVAKRWSSGEVAVKAIQAGADVLVMPVDPAAAIAGVVRAVRNGEISRARIDQSVRKILAAKVRLGLAHRRLVDPQKLIDELDPPEEVAKVQEIADRAVTLVRNQEDVVPLRAGRKAAFLVLAESRGSQQGRVFAAEVRKRLPDAQIVTLDPAASRPDLDQAASDVAQADVVVAAAFVSVAAYRGSVALAGGYPGLMSRLIESGKPVALIALGNPYLLRAFPGVAAYLTTYSTVAPSEIAAAKALFGDIAITGRLPVTIPGLANYGDGIQIGSRAAVAPPAATQP